MFRFWSLAFGLWSLVFGLWSLAFGLWPWVLGVGCWVFVSTYYEEASKHNIQGPKTQDLRPKI
jgi:hypothetical protein